MKKSSLLSMILKLLFVIAFNAVFFLLGGIGHTATVWLCYGMIHFAYLMLILTPAFAPGGKSRYLFGLSLGTISAVYFIAEFLTGMIFIFILHNAFKVALTVHIILTAIYLLVFLLCLLAAQRTADSQLRQRDEAIRISDNTGTLKGLVDTAPDKELRGLYEKAYDALKSSPSKSHSSVQVLEREIQSEIVKLTEAAASADRAAVEEAVGIIVTKSNERARMLRLTN